MDPMRENAPSRIIQLDCIALWLNSISLECNFSARKSLSGTQHRLGRFGLAPSIPHFAHIARTVVLSHLDRCVCMCESVLQGSAPTTVRRRFGSVRLVGKPLAPTQTANEMVHYGTRRCEAIIQFNTYEGMQPHSRQRELIYGTSAP